MSTLEMNGLADTLSQALAEARQDNAVLVGTTFSSEECGKELCKVLRAYAGYKPSLHHLQELCVKLYEYKGLLRFMCPPGTLLSEVMCSVGKDACLPVFTMDHRFCLLVTNPNFLFPIDQGPAKQSQIDFAKFCLEHSIVLVKADGSRLFN